MLELGSLVLVFALLYKCLLRRYNGRVRVAPCRRAKDTCAVRVSCVCSSTLLWRLLPLLSRYPSGPAHWPACPRTKDTGTRAVHSPATPRPPAEPSITRAKLYGDWLLHACARPGGGEGNAQARGQCVCEQTRFSRQGRRRESVVCTWTSIEECIAHTYNLGKSVCWQGYGCNSEQGMLLPADESVWACARGEGAGRAMVCKRGN